MVNQLTVMALVFLLLCSTVCHSEKQCFSFAKNQYEKQYCKIKAKGKGDRLPNFHEFQRNSIVIQALLLKPYADEFKVKKKSTDVNNVNNVKSVNNETNETNQFQIGATIDKLVIPDDIKEKPLFSSDKKSGMNFGRLSHCIINKQSIDCGGKVYLLTGNKGNNQINATVLSNKNTMSLPGFNGIITNHEQVSAYLKLSYKHYIIKMLSIGLGGSILSFEKFSYLFNELTKQNINFSERFEKMFFYLKQDKKKMSINTQISMPSSLILKNCEHFEWILVCTAQKKSYVFIAKADEIKSSFNK